jgi:pimeloyl-ACP methyl ester carboxylesterase
MSTNNRMPSARLPIPNRAIPLKLTAKPAICDFELLRSHRDRSRFFGRRFHRALRLAFFRVIVCSITSVLFCAKANAQLSYDHTTFLNGFGSDTMIWKKSYYDLGQPTPSFLSTYVNLRNVVLANVSDSLNYDGELLRIAPTLSGSNVLVGHSFGTLVARGLFFNETSRPNVAGIITIAAPHQGVVLADSAAKAIAFLVDVQRRVNDGVSAARLEFFVVGLFAQLLPVSPGHRSVIMAVAGLFFSAFINANSYDFGAFLNLPKLPAFQDLQTTSGTIQFLNSHFDDGAIPRANVFGIIPWQNATLRLASSMSDEDRKFGDAVNARNKAVTGFKVCKYVGYATIVMSGLGRKCAYAVKVLERVDDRWVRYTIGSEGGLPRYRNFDGLVPNERSVYPSTNGVSYNIGILGVDHFDIYSTRAGLYEVARAMQHIGMQSVNAVPETGWLVAIGGSNTVPRCGTNWTANPVGGVGPYTYTWTVGDAFFDTGTDNTLEFIPVSGMPAGSLTVTVHAIDSQGHTGGGTKYVSVDPPGDCY